MNTRAIGLNIFPSTPSSARIGMNVAMMIISPNCVTFRTSEVACLITPACSSLVRVLPRCARASESLRTQFSTMITAPSTMIPKSIAPRLIRLPLMPNCFIPRMAKSIATGIATAAITAPRKLPRSSTKMMMTRAAPSRRLF